MNGWWWYWKSGDAWPATASFHPPAYHAQLIPFSDKRSPMVANVWLGTSRLTGRFAGCGEFTLNAVLTAYPSGVTNPSVRMLPLESTFATTAGGAAGKTGVRAAISQM